MGSVEDIVVTPLLRISTEGGDVLRAMKNDDAGYVDFGEAYFSIVHPGAIKAWKRHLVMTLNLVVPVGLVKFIFVDKNDTVREEVIGKNCYRRLTVPPGIWFGFSGLSENDSLILNIANIGHDENEIERRPIHKYVVNWAEKK